MELEKMVKQRNDLLLHTFQHFLGNGVRVHGNVNNPKIILHNKWILSCYVHNFTINFCRDAERKEIDFRHKMTSNTPENFPDQAMFKKWIDSAERSECFLIKVDQEDLYLSGFNFIHQANTGEKMRYPVFSEYNPRIYYSMDFAEKVLQDIKDGGAPINIKLSVI